MQVLLAKLKSFLLKMRPELHISNEAKGYIDHTEFQVYTLFHLSVGRKTQVRCQICMRPKSMQMIMRPNRLHASNKQHLALRFSSWCGPQTALDIDFEWRRWIVNFEEYQRKWGLKKTGENLTREAVRQVLGRSDKLKMEINDIHKRRQHNDNPSGRDQLTARRRSRSYILYQENAGILHAETSNSQ